MKIDCKKTKCSMLVLKEWGVTTAALAAEGSSTDWELKNDSPLISSSSSSNNNDGFCGFLWLQGEREESGRFSGHALCLFKSVTYDHHLQQVFPDTALGFLTVPTILTPSFLSAKLSA